MMTRETGHPETSTPSSAGDSVHGADAPGAELTNGHRIAALREALGAKEDYGAAADLFHVLSDPTRLRLIAALAQTPLCVGELSQIVDLGQSATSHALRILRDRGIARATREGQQVRYQLADEHLRPLLAAGWSHALDAPPPSAFAPKFTGEIALEEHEKKKKKKKHKGKKKGK
ncbi:MAG: winged helix-turn-helix transcriptional regulator [Candidatus Sumerlaeia bacterium]|nr:winged helix-turn-helix transcriptional regulator [Candidatus Sumerlaeia bacterium]